MKILNKVKYLGRYVTKLHFQEFKRQYILAGNLPFHFEESKNILYDIILHIKGR